MSFPGCSICQESFSASAFCVATKCGHVFHKTCVSQWIVKSKTCPSCRAACPPTALNRIYFTPALDPVTDKLIAAEETVTKLYMDNEALQERLITAHEKQTQLKDSNHILMEYNKKYERLVEKLNKQMQSQSNKIK